jgi:hypothetical protein
MEGVLVTEKPSRNYPLYYILDKAPYSIAKQFSGEKEPYAFYKELLRKEEMEYRDWVKTTGIKSGLVLDLHDNTSHPDVLPYEEKDFAKYKLARKMPDGSVAAKADYQVETIFYSDSPRLPLLEDVMDSFKPTSKVKFDLDFHDPARWESMTFSDIEVVLEYYPVRIKTWPDTLERLPIEKGLQYATELISFLQRNYAKYRKDSQNI